jgi:hypothetical protein
MFGRRHHQEELEDARAEAQRWYDRLGGQIMNLPQGEDAATKQALVDASERYNAAGAQLEQATTVRQFALARETALEGLQYVRAVRVALGFDPGPDLPQPEAQRGVGTINEARSVDVEGREIRASPQAGGDTPYYYPGGRVQGRPVPAGWYSEPWWHTALGVGAGVMGGMVLFDALSGLFDNDGMGYGYGGYDGFDGGYVGDNDFGNGFGDFDGGNGFDLF